MDALSMFTLAELQHVRFALRDRILCLQDQMLQSDITESQYDYLRRRISELESALAKVE